MVDFCTAILEEGLVAHKKCKFLEFLTGVSDVAPDSSRDFVELAACGWYRDCMVLFDISSCNTRLSCLDDAAVLQGSLSTRHLARYDMMLCVDGADWGDVRRAYRQRTPATESRESVQLACIYINNYLKGK